MPGMHDEARTGEVPGVPEDAGDWRPETPAGDTDEVRRRHESNRAAWNEGAVRYFEEIESSARFIVAGKSNLHPVERRNLARYGPLPDWCRRAIHLQCAGGRDTLSLFVEGAHEVIGIDISDRMIEAADELSRRTGVPARFYRCDILDSPAELDGTADLVYTGRGALCWVQDIDRWARTAARLLSPGGVLCVYDGHPFQGLLRMDTPSLEIASDARYFGNATSGKGWSEQYIGSLEGLPVERQSRKYERSWTISEVVQAVINSRLVIDSLGEHPEDFWEAFPLIGAADIERIPNTFSLCARKPA
jgi:SAM-dependent methyltransferase